MPDNTQQHGSIGVFCGTRAGARTEYIALAREFGSSLASRGLELVYGAGGAGIMGALADAALAAGGRVTGIIPRDLHERERANQARGNICVVRSMHERKALMYRLSTGFAVLPGGIGTMDELMEVATWNQLAIISKPVVVVNCSGFFDPMIGMLDHLVREGFLSPDDRSLVGVARSTDEAFDLLGAARILAARTALAAAAASGTPDHEPSATDRAPIAAATGELTLNRPTGTAAIRRERTRSSPS